MRYKICETWMSEDKQKFQTIQYFSDDIYKPNVDSELKILVQKIYYNNEGELIKKETYMQDELKKDFNNVQNNK